MGQYKGNGPRFGILNQFQGVYICWVAPVPLKGLPAWLPAVGEYVDQEQKE